MRRPPVVLLTAVSLLLVACTASSPAGRPGQSPASVDGIVRAAANAVVRHIYPMLDSLVVEYEDAVLLPDRPAAELYSFTDRAGEGDGRAVTAVYTNDRPAVRDDESSVAGRYVVLQLDPVENPRPQEAWMPPSTAGRAVNRDGWLLTFRTDYSGVAVEQRFDAVAADGRVVRPAGPLPQLRREDVGWPEFEGFTIDQVLSTGDGDIHYSYYLPPNYDPARRYPLVVTLPGYGGLLHSLDDEVRGVNVFTDRSALAWTRAGEDVVVLAPQPAASGGSTQQVIELTEHFLDEYAINPARVYAMGYSAGGELMSQVLNTRADLFAAYVHASSRWNGNYDDVVENRVPVYVFMARSDEYYGPQRARDAYDGLIARYVAAGLSRGEAERLTVLNLPDDLYFNRQGIDYYHDGGMVAADDDTLVRWVLGQRKK